MRSYQGFITLVQISTREKDYIVDALKLRSQIQKLNEVLTNPKIVKVTIHPIELIEGDARKSRRYYVVSTGLLYLCSQFIRHPGGSRLSS